MSGTSEPSTERSFYLLEFTYGHFLPVNRATSKKPIDLIPIFVGTKILLWSKKARRFSIQKGFFFKLFNEPENLRPGIIKLKITPRELMLGTCTEKNKMK